MARGPCSCIGCIGLRPTLTTLTCFNVHVKPHYCRAAATGNCAVTNVNYNEKKYYVVTWTVSSPRCTCADANDCVRSLCATLLVGSVAVQC